MSAFDIAFLVFTAVIGGLRGTYHWRARAHRPRKRDTSWSDRALLLCAMAGMMPIPLLEIFTPIFAPFDVAIPSALSWAGVVLLALGALLFWRSHADLGDNWSARLAIQPEHRLVENGVYRRIRHPMYAALLLSGLGQFLVLANWIGGGSLLAVGVLFYAVRIPREERLMLEEFGETYRDYMRRTGRVVPRPRGRS
ncbi:MAG: protein-S-isoprenylcysteine O-methyltransferase [Rhodospirillaceae bacterium]|nr:protein-S-isoprenylcysteine O-methyltransferase [Rhodospirillaceae bacterium]